MYCPICKVQGQETRVVDSRLSREGTEVRRRRECLYCQRRFTTLERVELNLPRIIKRDGRRSVFEEEKLRSGFLKALEKRPVTAEQVEASLQRIMHSLYGSGEREIPSQWLGELVMNELRALDAVAYVRFASVYRSFQDVNAFQDEIQRLQKDLNNPTHYVYPPHEQQPPT